VNAVQLNVGALQGPVSNLVGLVSTLNVAALQANISNAELRQTGIAATSTQLQTQLTSANAGISQLGESNLLQTLLKLNATRAHVRRGGVMPAAWPAASYTCPTPVLLSAFTSLDAGDEAQGSIGVSDVNGQLGILIGESGGSPSDD